MARRSLASIRSVYGALRSLLADRPRIVPFLPLLARKAIGGRRTGQIGLPALAANVHASVPATPPAGDLTVFSIIRNGITNGYPLVEAYGCWLDVAREIVVLDGESDDGTREALDALARLDPRVTVESRPWPRVGEGGSAIAEFTTTALDLARGRGGRLMYIQADEIYTREQRERMAAFTGGAYEFAGCVNFWNSFDTVLANEFPMRYLRLFPADATVRSVDDAFSFDVAGTAVTSDDDEILHYGWCFPVNILLKHISHSRLYRDNPAYVVRGHLAQLMLDQRRYDRRLLDALAPGYRPVPFAGAHPPSVRHLLGLQVYDPTPGLRELAAGVRW